MKTNRFTLGVDFQSAAQEGKSGVGYYTKGMVEALAKEYPEVDIYVHYYNFLNRSTVEIPDLPNVHPVKSALFHPKIINFLRRLSIEIPFNLLLGKRCDVYFFPSFVNYPVPRSSTVVTTIHDLAYLEVPESVSERNRKDLTKHMPRYIARSTKIATVSNHSKSRIREFYPKSPDIFVTYSPPSHTHTNNGQSKPTRDLPENYILFVGNLEPRKNLIGLLDAYAKLEARLQKIHPLLIVGGNGWNNEKIKSKILSMQKKGFNVVTSGYVTGGELASIYKNAVAFAFPSLYEGYGIPPLEAMSFGVPVLASRIDVLREVCGNAAQYCDPLNVNSIAKNLTIILDDMELRSKLQKNGKDRAQYFTWQKAAKILYENLTA